MLKKRADFDGVTVYIISQDAVFARMLELELCEAGMTAIRAEKFPDESEEEEKTRVFTVSSEILEAELTRSAHIEFGFSDEGTGNSRYYFKRPFPVDAFVEAVTELVLSLGDCASECSEPTNSKRTENAPVAVSVPQVSADITYDGDQNAFFYGEERLELTETEFSLLALLYGRRGETVTREEILTYVWGREENENVRKTNLTDVYIRYLREKIDQRFDVRLILSVRGVGYKLKRF